MMYLFILAFGIRFEMFKNFLKKFGKLAASKDSKTEFRTDEPCLFDVQESEQKSTQKKI